MSSTEQGPTVQRRLLIRELRLLRGSAGLTLDQVAAGLFWSLSKIRRIENGMVGVSTTDLRALLELYGVTGTDRIAEIARLARGARKPAWRDGYRDSAGDGAYLTYLGYEAGASFIRSFQPLIIPALLQTEDYARAVLSQHAPGRAEALVELRMRHQQDVLGREDPPEQVHVLDQAAIQRQVGGPDIMQRQLRHLALATARPEVTIRVVPFDAGAHPGMRGPFVILGFDDGTGDVLYLESTSGGVLADTDNSLRALSYRTDFEQLQQMSSGAEPYLGSPEVTGSTAVEPPRVAVIAAAAGMSGGHPASPGGVPGSAFCLRPSPWARVRGARHPGW
jgi:transcriptional regulator with XRE-family HTH domain